MKNQPKDVKRIKKSIATELLMDRLGLNDDWRDPSFLISLPASLALPAHRKLSRDDVADLKSGIRNLAKLGCQTPVIHWCLTQLDKEAEGLRQGNERFVVLDDDEAKNREYIKSRPLATRQDMRGIAQKASDLARTVRRYRIELELVLNAASDIPLPEGMFTDSPDVIEAVDVLLAYLNWVKKLTLAWESPAANALMKSKGMLYLLVYVWIKVRLYPTKAKPSKIRAGSGEAAKYRLPPRVSHEIAFLVHAYTGSAEGYSPENLNDKLQDCAVKEPEVFELLVKLMTRLDEVGH